MPPTITLKQATGFDVSTLKAALSGRGDEIDDLAKTILVTGHLPIISFAQNFNQFGRGCCGSLCWAVFSLLPRERKIATDTAANKYLNK